MKTICLLFGLTLAACSANSSTVGTEAPPGACGPSSCPIPPSAPDPDSTCHQAVMNLIRVGLFRLAEVDPPTPAQEPLFCKLMEQRGYDLKCIALARSALEASECKRDPVSA